MRMRRAGRVVTYDDWDCERARDHGKLSLFSSLLSSDDETSVNWDCLYELALSDQSGRGRGASWAGALCLGPNK